MHGKGVSHDWVKRSSFNKFATLGQENDNPFLILKGLLILSKKHLFSQEKPNIRQDVCLDLISKLIFQLPCMTLF